MPKISIIIPVFNIEGYVRRCLDSALRQTLEDIEVIVVDDCSTDGSISIIEEYAAKDNRMIVLRHDSNHGTFWARETGLEIASGEYVMFVDGDDEILPAMCERMCSEAMIQSADLVSCGIDYIFPDGTSKPFCPWLSHGNDAHGVLKSLLSYGFTYNLCGKLFRADLLKNHQILHLDGFINGEDSAMFSSIAPNIHKAVCIGDLLYLYHQNPGSATQKRYSEGALDNIFLSHEFILGSVSEFGDLRDDAEWYVLKRIVDLRRDGYDRKFLQSLAEKHGIWRIMSFSNLRRLLGFRKALTYWSVTHLDGFAHFLGGSIH